MTNPDIAGILLEAEANRRRDRAASAAANSTSVPASTGNYTVNNAFADQVGGNPVVLGPDGKIPAELLPAGYGSGGGGGATFKEYVHTQSTAVAVWTVAHNLGGYPPPVVLDAGGDEMIPAVSYVDANTITLGFSRPQTGTCRVAL